MSEPIVGIDELSETRMPWWQIGFLILCGLAVVIWVVDLVHKTDTERVASQLERLFDAYADGDGALFCDVLTEESRRDVTAQGVISGTRPGSTCAEVAEDQLSQIDALGAPVGKIGELEASDFEDSIEIEGHRATISTETGLTSSELVLLEEDGEWLVDLTGPVSQVQSSPAPGASEDELIAAADHLCVSGFAQTSGALSELIAGDRPFEQAAAAWLDKEEAMLADLEALAEGRESSALTTLVNAERKHVALVRVAAASRRSLRQSADELAAENARFAQTAGEEGFAEFGCAVPPAG